MKQTIKYLILALLIPAAYCFTACDTDIEPIDQQIIKPDQQDPAQYAAYLAALKAYKASEHYIVYASLANAPAVPGSEKAFLRSLPDSLDIVALENAGNLTEYDIEDIPQAQAKGTKILYTVDYNTLAESTDAVALGTYLDKVIEDFGAEWRNAGCSICLRKNPDKLVPNERSISTSNRNFEGRQGKGSRTHLASPAVAAATAIRGTICSPADL